MGTALNGGGGSVQITAAGGTTYTPGVTQRISVKVSDPAQKRWGFQLTARLASDSKARAGILTPTDNATLTICTTATFFEVGCTSTPTFQYIEHTLQGAITTATGAGNTFSFDWTPPATASGDVILYAAGNAANGNTIETGDHIYTTSLRLSPAASGPPLSTGPVKILPQLAFGGGWYSALYFTNTSSAPISFAVNFIGDDGTPLTLPSVGGSSTTVNLAASGSAIIEAPNTGSLQQGYVSIALPVEVLAYGVFRSSSTGLPPLEAVVPLSSASSIGSTLIWDDTGLITAVAIVNPSAVDTIVAVTVKDTAGAVIGTTTVSLAAKNKTAIALRNLPGLGAMEGKRGSADFAVTTGNVAVLGLRFGSGGVTFTSIPTTER